MTRVLIPNIKDKPLAKVLNDFYPYQKGDKIVINSLEYIIHDIYHDILEQCDVSHYIIVKRLE